MLHGSALTTPLRPHPPTAHPSIHPPNQAVSTQAPPTRFCHAVPTQRPALPTLAHPFQSPNTTVPTQPPLLFTQAPLPHPPSARTLVSHCSSTLSRCAMLVLRRHSSALSFANTVCDRGVGGWRRVWDGVWVGWGGACKHVCVCLRGGVRGSNFGKQMSASARVEGLESSYSSGMDRIKPKAGQVVPCR